MNEQEERERPMFWHICNWVMPPGVLGILFSIQRGRLNWMPGAAMAVILIALGITSNFKWVPKRNYDSDSQK